MGSTGRSRKNPLGRADSIACQKGNILACRALALMILCAAKGIFWCLEQPSSSCMEWHPLFQQLLRLVSVRKFQFRMSKFGAPTPKRTILYSSNLPTKQWFQVYTVWFLFFCYSIQNFSKGRKGRKLSTAGFCRSPLHLPDHGLHRPREAQGTRDGCEVS